VIAAASNHCQTPMSKIHFYGFTADSDATDTSTADAYLQEYISKKWASKEWTVPGHPVLDPPVSEVGTIAEPVFEVCSIKGGKLTVSQASITAFAGNNVLLRARLLCEATKSDSEFAKPEMTIGGETSTADGSDESAKKPRLKGSESEVNEPDTLLLIGKKTVAWPATIVDVSCFSSHTLLLCFDSGGALLAGRHGG
jgi:hypothetical protein